jgi:HSP20 family molecular chaperone IbpA
MTADARPLDEYVEAEIQRLLTENAGVAEQGITVVRREHTLTLRGEVESERRRDEICRLITARFPDVPLACDIGIVRAQAPSDAEELP